MSLIYRAIWRDNVNDLEGHARSTFDRWVSQKHPSLPSSISELVTVESNGRDVVAELRTVRDEALMAVEATLSEESGSERWLTRMRVLTDGEEQWFWVDLERVAKDAFSRPNVVAPGLVRELIEGGVAPHLGPTRLTTQAVKLIPEDVECRLTDQIKDETRELPIVVFSHDPLGQPRDTMFRANQAAKILAGVAQVFAVSPEGHDQLVKGLGEELAVYGGAARMYLPGSLDHWRHRYIPRNIVERNPRAAGELFGKMLSGAISARRAPDLYGQLRPLLRELRGKSADELLELADQEVSDRNALIDELREKISIIETDYLDVLEDNESLRTELANKNVTIRLLLEQDTGEQQAELELPNEVDTIEQAVELAREHLGHLVIHPDACRDLEALDSAVETRAWANATWQALRALNAYAQDVAHVSGFWDWCQRGGKGPDTWPATMKKLAMRESETVMKNESFRSCRILPVSTDVSPDGKALMEAHIKIAEGGGPLAPRLYFLDKSTETQKVHIGFIGPHSHMPNSRTN